MNYIPKIIHMIWFGENPYSPIVECCIASWRKICPGYTIKLWNEQNFDINSNVFVKEAYEAKKYAFVSDYVRLYALYHEGGVYIDSDVEVIKNFDLLLEGEHAVTGYSTSMWIPAGFMAAEKHNEWIKVLLDYYQDRHFVLPDGSYDQRVNNAIISEISATKYGFRRGRTWLEFGKVRLYPMLYFTPYRKKTFKLCQEKLKDRYRYFKIDKEKTYCIHYSMASWGDGDHGIVLYLKRLVRDYLPQVIVEWIERRYYCKKFHYKE